MMTTTMISSLMSGIVSEDGDDGIHIGSTQSDNEINDGSESDSGDDEGGGTDQLISTRLGVESVIEEEDNFDFEDDSL